MAYNLVWLMTTLMAGETAWYMIDSNGFTNNMVSGRLLEYDIYLDSNSSLGTTRPFRNEKIMIVSQRGHCPMVYTSYFQLMITLCRWRCFKPACRALLERPVAPTYYHCLVVEISSSGQSSSCTTTLSDGCMAATCCNFVIDKTLFQWSKNRLNLEFTLGYLWFCTRRCLQVLFGSL